MRYFFYILACLLPLTLFSQSEWVILNLFTNDFYACNEQQKNLKLEGAKIYALTVTVKMSKVENSFVISVTDNGNGIPKKVIKKIFEPFFTATNTQDLACL